MMSNWQLVILLTVHGSRIYEENCLPINDKVLLKKINAKEYLQKR
jgi:hypothetical protein